MGQPLSENRDQFALRLNCSMTTDSDLLNKSFSRGLGGGEKKKGKMARKSNCYKLFSLSLSFSLSRYSITENLTLYTVWRILNCKQAACWNYNACLYRQNGIRAVKYSISTFLVSFSRDSWHLFGDGPWIISLSSLSLLSLPTPFLYPCQRYARLIRNVHAHTFLRDKWMKLSAKRTNEMREMMLALTDQEGRVGMNESRSSGSGSTLETSLLPSFTRG